MFTTQNTEGYTNDDLATLNEAVALLREWYDCEGLEEYSMSDAVFGASCSVPMIARNIADTAADRLKLSLR